MALFSLGVALGVLLTIPLIVLFSRRTARNVRQLEERACAADRLEEQAMLTGGLAHEIKNPLSSVNLNIQLLQEDLTDLQKDAAQRRASDPSAAATGEKIGRIQRRFESLARETQRLRTILDDFLRFAGRMKLENAPVDINALIGELVDFFQPQAQVMGVNIRTQPSAGTTTVNADASLLKQALMNLMINACQAMAQSRDAKTPNGGASELFLRTQRTSMASAQGPKEAVEIHVTDTGPGIPLEDQPKIFQPYFSTKKGGTGLGLPTSRRIAEEHGGTLTVHSESGKGSDFVVTLPA